MDTSQLDVICNLLKQKKIARPNAGLFFALTLILLGVDLHSLAPAVARNGVFLGLVSQIQGSWKTFQDWIPETIE
ncbi:hypothetical protein [Pseudomonas sp. NPDC087614]|uniref:hypothetical protein n=1 Tax=Pseudomonas sp. NPDC087614 TaxID=3364442 RepID=UPI0038250203